MPTPLPVYGITLPGPALRISMFARVPYGAGFGWRMSVKSGRHLLARVHADPAGVLDITWYNAAARRDFAALVTIFPTDKGAYPGLQMNEHRLMSELAAHEYLRRRLNKVSNTHLIAVADDASPAHAWVQIPLSNDGSAVEALIQKMGSAIRIWRHNHGWSHPVTAN